MPNTQSEALVEILPEIQRAARRVSGEWTDVVDPDDLEQEISLRLLEKDYATTVRDMDLPAQRYVLFKIGGQLASREAIDLERFRGHYTYSTGEVRGLLAKGALTAPGYTELEAVVETYEAHTEGGEVVAVPSSAVGISVEVIDLRTSFETLTEKQQGLLVKRYVDGIVSPEGKERVAVQRATDALTHAMNRARRRAHSEFGGR